MRVSDFVLALASLVAQPVRSRAADAIAAMAADMVFGREITAVLFGSQGRRRAPIGGPDPGKSLWWAAEVRYTYPNKALRKKTGGI
ncbi:hypothetical protein GCM10010052_32100 [Paenarthrobacter histidinolovorans]|nr:hypothetical protein GCM10010052_32100 [Paenarthrobacter histidinolovorans]